MRQPSLRRSLTRILVLAAVSLSAMYAHALDADARLKWFSTASLLPAHDIQRQQHGTPGLDHSLDMRLMFKQDAGPVRLLVEHSTVLLSGDSFEFNRATDSAVDQTVQDDGRRRWDLTWEIEEGQRHRSFHRLDRLAVQWQPGNWSVTVGRQAVSWGAGIVFQPMDLFSPFAPTVVDRDYKAGDDVLLIDRLLDNGHDLQFLHVMRRDPLSGATGSVSSSAFKWHGYSAGYEFEMVAAQHYDQPVYAAGLRLPLGQALLRTDVVASRSRMGDWHFSGMLNADISFVAWQRNAYVFAEYFHNGWGVNKLPVDGRWLPQELTERLQRGELFNLMRNYLAVGGSYEWHPLVTGNATVITNLNDNSQLLQISAAYLPSDNQSLQLGWVEPLGAAGDEFGGVPLLGDTLTTGGASRVYVRWVYYL